MWKLEVEGEGFVVKVVYRGEKVSFLGCATDESLALSIEEKSDLLKIIGFLVGKYIRVKKVEE